MISLHEFCYSTTKQNNLKWTADYKGLKYKYDFENKNKYKDDINVQFQE